MSDPTRDDPPPDGSLRLYLLGAVLTIVVGALGVDVVLLRSSRRALSVADASTTFGIVAGALAPLLLPVLWGYASKSAWGVFVKSGIAGLVGGIAVIAILWGTTEVPQGDDVLPLFFVIVGPILVMAYAGAGLAIAAGGYLAFWLRQRRRITWLARVMQGKNPHYRVGPLDPANAEAPLFLRFREGTSALWRVNPHPSYREHVDDAVIARVPPYV